MGITNNLYCKRLKRKGKKLQEKNKNGPQLTVNVYRYSSESDEPPHVDSYEINLNDCGPMILDVLMHIKDNIDPTLAFRKSCREGICGSCSVNINGKNTLACITRVSQYEGREINIFPLPHLRVVRDLVPDMQNFYKQYASVRPWLQQSQDKEISGLEMENLQSIEERNKLDGSWECVLCACCATSCPSYWWHSEDSHGFLGPAVALQVNRWVLDSRDEATDERLEMLAAAFNVYKCYTIMNCVEACPKGLNPAKSIANLKKKIAAKKLHG